MGCCCSTEESHDEDSVTSPLLSNGHARSTTRKATATSTEPSSQQKVSFQEQRENDEQSILNSILTQTMTSIIDVTATDSHGVEHHEYVGRMKHYNQAMNAIPTQSLQRRRPNCLLADTQNVEKILSQQPVADDYLMLVKSFAQNVNDTLNAIHVEPQEDLVVQFGATVA